MASRSSEAEKAEVSDLLGRLNLTAEEADVVVDSDDEAEVEMVKSEWSLIGKVLSLKPVHVMTIIRAMKPAWGNPKGLEIRSVGDKKDNLFIADFEGQVEKDWALDCSPWMIGRYAVILQSYDARLRPSDVCFDRMSIWARVLNLPFGWMNAKKGDKVARSIGVVEKLDINEKGKASGSFLRARVAIELNKPLRRGLFLRDEVKQENAWYEIQYEKLPFFCKSCGILGHFELDCPSPALQGPDGKLPYDCILRAPEDKKKLMSFGESVTD